MLVTNKNKFIILTVIFMLVFLLPINPSIAQNKININTASQQELETLPGIGPSKAKAIIDYRTQKEPFSKIEDIMNVSGIGQATFNNIKNLITTQMDTNVNTNETQTNNSTEINNEIENENQEAKITYSDKIVINEILPNPDGSDDGEWIELKNLSTEDVSLNNWQISDATDKKFTISNQIILANGFLVLERAITKISLNNSGGDQVKLFWPDGTLINKISYSGDAEDNVSFARDENGNFFWTETLTKNKKNIITIKDTDKPGYGTDNADEFINESEQQKKQSSVYSEFKDKVLITEFLPNPYGLDNNENEWIELYNTSTEDIVLDNWKLKDNISEYVFKNTKIPSKNFLVLNRGTTNLVLNNEDGDFLELYDNKGIVVYKIAYTKNAPEQESYNFCPIQNKWLWLKETSKNSENICPPVNKNPVAYFELENTKVDALNEIIADAAESYDLDGNIVKYVWQFENLVQEIDGQQKMLSFETKKPKLKFKFLSSGKQKITVSVFDELGAQDDFSQNIEVKIPEIQKENWKKILINELLPDPEGSDVDLEFIELYNQSNENIDLYGFKIDDEEDGSSPYKIQESTLIPANGFLVLGRNTTKIALNNNSDSVRLFDPNGDLIHQVIYDYVEVEMSYARGEDGIWFWTSEITRGMDNVRRDAPRRVSTIQPTINYYQNVSLEEIRDLEKGDKATTQGIVSVEPGVLGANIFYVSNENGFGGIQVYSYQKDFPALILGDKVQVAGEISSYYNEARIKTKTQNNIKILSHENLLTPNEVTLDEITEELEGSLIKIKGDVTEIKGDYFWIDDGLSEIRVYAKNTTDINLEKLGLMVLDKVEIVGILSQTSSGFRVLPRYKDDIIIQNVLGEKTESTLRLRSGQAENTKKESSNTWKDYLIATLLAGIIILGGLIYKNRLTRLRP